MEIISIVNEKINLNHLFKNHEILRLIGKNNLLNHIEIIRLNNQEVLMNQGDIPDYLYFVFSGRLLAYKNSENWKESIVGYIKSGEMIGEMAIIADTPRTASIIALRQSILIRIPNIVIKSFLLSNPQILVKISSLISNRLTKLMNNSPSKKSKEGRMGITALIAAGATKIPEEFISKFSKILSEYQDFCLLNESEFNKLMNERYSQIDQSNTCILRSQLLAELEQENSKIILDCGYELGEWSIFCLQNSDCFLYVADERYSAELNPLDNYINNSENRLKEIMKILVCIHPASINMPEETYKWIEHRKISSVNHICLERSETIHRLARILSGRCIGLVLSGGGLLGLAHIGVLQAFEEENIAIDAIGGVSSGAIIAALFALGLDSKAIIKKIKSSLKKIKPMMYFRWQIPLASFMSPNYGKKMIQYLCGDFNIEDLWINFFCLACNLSTTQDKVFKSGSLINAVLASNSLPSILSPVLINGELFVDGGVTNTMPADIMKEEYGGTTIAVNVSQKRAIETDRSHTHFPSTLEIVLNWINPSKTRVKSPLLPEIVARAFIIGNKRKLAEVIKIVDYLIEPDFSSIPNISIRHMDKIIETGYQAAKKEIINWKLNS